MCAFIKHIWSNLILTELQIAFIYYVSVYVIILICLIIKIHQYILVVEYGGYAFKQITSVKKAQQS